MLFVTIFLHVSYVNHFYVSIPSKPHIVRLEECENKTNETNELGRRKGYKKFTMKRIPVNLVWLAVEANEKFNMANN